MSKPPPKGTRAAIYGRDASLVQSDAHAQPPIAVADQIALCRLFAEDHGWDVVAVYIDAPQTGGWAGQGLIQAMRDATKGLFKVLLVRDVARLGPDAGFVQDVLNALGAVGVSVGIVPNPPVLCEECARMEDTGEVDDE